MSDSKPELKLFTKVEFLKVKDKYEEIYEDAQTVIDNANDSDVLVLTVKEGSGLKVLDAKIIDENNEDLFIQILKEGVAEA